MQRRWFWALPFVLALPLTLLIVVPSMAYYATVSGELRDSETGNLWQYGANVEVFNCNTLATITTGTVDAAPAAGYGTFTLDISSVSSDMPLCIEVNFIAGPNGDPGNAVKGPYPNRSDSTGDLNTGVYFTGTGPTAVSLHSISTTSVANLPPAAGGLALLAMTGVVILRRRRPRPPAA